jgi:hypothetical protein
VNKRAGFLGSESSPTYLLQNISLPCASEDMVEGRKRRKEKWRLYSRLQY